MAITLNNSPCVPWNETASSGVYGSFLSADSRDERQIAPEARFQELAARWKRETAHLSPLARRYRHESYKEILAMEQAAIPFILAEMRRDPDWWFHALETLSGENPAENADTFYEGVDDWISWGQSKGHIPCGVV